MPIYDYRCSACGVDFSVTLSIKELDTAKVVCPKCSSPKVMKRITAFSAKTSKKS